MDLKQKKLATQGHTCHWKRAWDSSTFFGNLHPTTLSGGQHQIFSCVKNKNFELFGLK
jgi:hypothetical protein